MIAFQDPLSQLPPAASTFAPDVDALFYFTFWLCVFFFFLITGILGYSVVKYRRRTEDQPAASNVTHNTTLEVVWTVIPLILVMIIFVWGWKGSLDMTVAPANALRYKIVAKQWDWFITHPGDFVAVNNEMYVPVNTPVKLEMESQDVLHAFFVPAFRVKRDVLPGRYQTLWFEATEIGSYDIFCAEYCGMDHSQMRGTVHVVSQEVYDEQPWNVWPDDPIEGGLRIYQLCKSCHTTDGTILVGPSFLNLYGRQEQVALHPDGRLSSPLITTVTVDDDYIMESIRTPNVKIVVQRDGGDWVYGAMTPFDERMIPDERLPAIIEYIKSLQDGN